MPPAGEIDQELPAPEVVADALGLAGVLDRSKLGPQSIFYLPSCPDDECIDQHQMIVCPGAPIDATWLQKAAGALLAARQAEQDRIAAEAHKAAQARLQARIAAGFDPNDSLIEKLRARLDLASLLTAHNYDRRGNRWRHAASMSGSYGLNIKTLGGIERVYSHNAGDPLHRDNLPDWTGGASALDVVDVAIILDYGGDRPKALREMATRFGISKPDERRTLAALIFRLIRSDAPQEAVEAAAFLEGVHLGMSRAEVISTALWCAQQLSTRKAA